MSALPPTDLPRLRREVLTTSYVAALALGLLVLVATPVVVATLNLGSPLPAVLIAATAVPLTVMGGQAGILQGERRWGPLAGIYLAVGVGRLGFGAVALVVEPDTTGAMIGVAVGAVLPVVVGWWALRHSPHGRAPRAGSRRQALVARWARGGVLRETGHNSHALLAFFALSNTDVLIARSTLSEHQAGLYAGGLILTKAVLFLPQFVVVIAFPSMAKRGAGRRMHLASLGVVAAIGGATVVGTAALSALAVVFVGGPEYAELQGRLWTFAALGTLLALLQLLVYYIVARQRQRTVLLVWVAMAALIGTAPLVSSLSFLLGVVVAVDAALFLVLLARSLAPSYHRDAPTPATMSHDPAPSQGTVT